jgi:hypothetical protein
MIFPLSIRALGLANRLCLPFIVIVSTRGAIEVSWSNALYASKIAQYAKVCDWSINIALGVIVQWSCDWSSESIRIISIKINTPILLTWCIWISDSVSLKVKVIWTFTCHAHSISTLAALRCKICLIIITGTTSRWKSCLTCNHVVY